MNDPIATAFLDALAEGETDGTPGQGYDWLFGASRDHPDYRRFTDFSKFPVWEGVRGPWGMTHAAGRYQFQPVTYAEQATRLGLLDFSPPRQDAAAWDLASRVYRGKIGAVLLVDLERGILDQVAPALHATWTSLNPLTFPLRFRLSLARATAAAAAKPPAAPAPTDLNAIIEHLQTALALAQKIKAGLSG